MNELKPVAWHTEDHTDDFSATTYDKELAERWEMKGWPLTPMYYAIPDTHRVVSVEFLNVVAMIVTEARDYYSDMNDNVCPSYADPWEHAADACIELRDIIDNKEAT